MNSRCDPISAVDVVARDCMYRLLARHFTGVERRCFDADLVDKTHVLRLFDGKGELCGFSTFALCRLAGCQVVVSGDTVSDPETWSAARLAPAWITAVRDLSGGDLSSMWWLLICSGERTYRFLPTFFRCYVPQRDRSHPTLLALRDRMAAERFPGAFDAHSGVVRLTHPQGLQGHLKQLPTHLRESADGYFFRHCNPGFQAGDELACLCPLAEDNLTLVGRRVLHGDLVR
jgi:hypothetical protein